MKAHWWNVLVMAAFVPSAACQVGAQEVAADRWINVPGLGAARIDDLPSKFGKNIRVPGVEYDEPAAEYADLPANTHPEEPELDILNLPEPEPTPHVSGDVPAAKAVQREIVHHEVMEQLRTDRVGPEGAIPDDAYRKAWEQIQQMPAVEPPAASEKIEPTSLLEIPASWLALAVEFLMPAKALAQSSTWYPIGPAPFLTDSGVKHAGIVDAIAVDPQNSSRIYLGTAVGGVWKTANGGVSWTPTSDNAPSMQTETVAVHPTNSSIVFAGTGLLDGVLRKAGTLRTTDTATSWSQIGPTWCIQPGDPSPACQSGQNPCKSGGTCVRSDPAQCSCTDAAKSDLAVVEVAVDDSQVPIRVWAATSRGIWYSDNAHDPSKTPSQIVWTHLTNFPNSGDVKVNHIFVSPRNKLTGSQTLFASVVLNATLNGWYRSDDRGATWTSLNAAPLPSNPKIERSAISAGGLFPGFDVLYSIVGDVSTTCDGTPILKSRLFKAVTSASITSWSLVTATKTCSTVADCCDEGAISCQCISGLCSESPDCGGMRSVQADPTNANIVALGTEYTYRSTQGGLGGFFQLGRQAMHVDIQALTFDPNNHLILFDGNDGGIWKTPDFSAAVPTWTNLNGNLANVEFHRTGVPDRLNAGTTIGGTQDNGTVKGANAATWVKVALGGGDDTVINVDPKTSNYIYSADLGGGSIQRSIDGGATVSSITTGLPLPILNGAHDKLAMDPASKFGATKLVAYSQPQDKVYRTSNADGASPTWSSITSGTLPDVISLAISHSDPNLVFATTHGGPPGQQDLVWRTQNGTSWSALGAGQLPSGRFLTSIAIDPSQACTISGCVLYTTATGFDGSGPVGHIFRSGDAGQNWVNIGGTPCSGGGCVSFPNLPAQKVAVHPSNQNVVYVATDMGIFQGTKSGSTWTWGTFTDGFPRAALVSDLTVHPEAGVLRAYTFGRSAWEVQAFPIPNPELKVNAEPVGGENSQAEVLDSTVKASSNSDGTLFSIAWVEDRPAANNWHLYSQTYNANGTGVPLALGPNLRVDDTTPHVVLSASVAAHLTMTGDPLCSRFAWDDDRMSLGTEQHIFFQYACSNGYKLYLNDVRADQHPIDISASNPAIANQFIGASLDFAIAWEAQQSAASSSRSVYGRFFNLWGVPKGNQFQVSSAGWDARKPTLAVDASNNVYVAWEEFDAASQTGRILVSKYDPNGQNLLAGPAIVATGAGFRRREPGIAVTAGGSIVLAWWEQKLDGSLPERVFRRRYSASLTSLEPATQVNQPPAYPVSAQRGMQVAVAADSSTSVNDFSIAWSANANEYTLGVGWNVFSRTFDASGANVTNDYRVDLAPRGTAVRHPTATRGPVVGTVARTAYAWRDSRAGHYDVYARALSTPP